MKKVVLIGIDGFDPTLAEAMLQEGLLPGFAELKKRGGWSRLQTTNPALSPTAWSTIATGANPGQHGLFDFIYRDPGSYLPKLSVTRPNSRNYFGNPTSAFLPARQGEAFWAVSSSHQIPTTVIKWPVSFPPESIEGNMLSGLGVPDIRGTAGRYTVYSTKPTKATEKMRGEVIRLTSRSSHIESILIGPDGVTVPLAIGLDSKETITLELQTKRYQIKKGQWSPWIPISFQRFGFPRMEGILRFYLESLEPDIHLYASAIHMNPEKPPFPISSPVAYASELAKALGAFHTLGLPEETNGLVDEMISEDAFLRHAEDIFKERESLFWYEWNRFKKGVFAFVFDTLDRIQHTMWCEGSGPNAKSPDAMRRIAVVKDHYRKLDNVIQRLLKDVNENDLVAVVSDHGFSTFEKALNVNSWLRDEGFLVLKNGPEGLPLFENVDWKKTKAYALGFVSLYINQAAREREGTVSEKDAEVLKKQIIQRALAWVDPSTGEKVIHAVYDSRFLYHGALVDKGPDLVLAPRAGYRVSWQTGYGAAPVKSVEPNLRAWRADHIVDPSLVPGVLFANQPVDFSHPSVMDIAPTILKALDVAPPQSMEGRSLL